MISQQQTLERALLGSLVMADDAKAALSELDAILPPSVDGWTPALAVAVSAFRRLVELGRPSDLVALKGELESRGELARAGGPELLLSLVDSTPSFNVSRWAHDLADLKRKAAEVALIRTAADKAEKSQPYADELEKLSLLQAQAVVEYRPESSATLLENLPEETDWVFAPFFLRGGITQIQGAPKGGKSSFALYCALTLSLGRWESGKLRPPSAPRRILYVPYEDGARRLKRRLLGYARGLGLSTLPHDLLLFKSPPLWSFPADYSRWEKTIKREKVDLVFFDTMAYIHRGDENKATDMAPVMASLKRLAVECSVAVCLIHHTRKPGSQGDSGAESERGRGSSLIAGAHDVIVDWGKRVRPNVTAITLVSKEDSADTEFAVEYVLESERPLKIKWNLDALYEREDMARAKDAIRQAIEEHEKADLGGITKNELAAATGFNPRTVHRHLISMAHDIEAKLDGKVKKYTLKPVVDTSGIEGKQL